MTTENNLNQGYPTRGLPSYVLRLAATFVNLCILQIMH